MSVTIDAHTIALATGGEVIATGGPGRICTDTRALRSGDWFLALVGERFDGHTFLERAAAAGATGCVVERVPEGWTGACVRVDDTLRALQDLGRHARLTFAGPVVGLTGSSGKTTTRTLIGLAVSPLGAVHQTEGNLNNHIGVPLTLLARPPEATVQVVEMGTSGPGEIEVLADIATPDVRLIVNIGPAHLEELGGLQGVAHEKGALFRSARPGDVVCINVDDPFLAAMDVPDGTRRVEYGSRGDVVLLEAEVDGPTLSTRCVWQTPAGRLSARIPAPGRHIAHNAAGALAVALALGLDLRESAAALEGYEPVGMRLRAEHLPSGALVLNDAYNANPQSMAASLRLLATLPGRRAAVLGDMLELGPDEGRYHVEVAALAVELGLDLIVLVGPRMVRAAAACPEALAFEDPLLAVGPLRDWLGAGDHVLLKGSRGARVERVLQGLVDEEALMLYWLFVEQGLLAETLPGTGVFRYISFRTAWGLITALAITYAIFPSFIEWMKRQKMNQIIRDDGPESHRLTKIGTPTMGGVCILVGVAVATLLWARLDTPVTWMSLLILLGYGAIGFVDDWKKVMHKSTAGLAGRWKIVFQILIGGTVLAWGYQSGQVPATVSLPFLKEAVVDFSALWTGAPTVLVVGYIAFALVVLVGASNAVNLTDGLDGLAIGPVMTSSATYGAIAYLVGNTRFADYLGIPYVDGAGELAVVAFAVVGSGLGFLWYNSYPAQIFMGDVGSLALGGTLGIFSVITKHEILLVVVGGIFVLEAVSVILQVGSFKMTGKRIFAMAPIHHHYEKKGWSEPKIIVRFWIISIVLALVALSTLKLR